MKSFFFPQSAQRMVASALSLASVIHWHLTLSCWTSPSWNFRGMCACIGACMVAPMLRAGKQHAKACRCGPRGHLSRAAGLDQDDQLRR